MKRYAICQVTYVQEWTEWRPAIEDYTPIYQQRYKMGKAHSLVQFSAQSVDAITADPRILVLPDITLDSTMMVLANQGRTRLRDELLRFAGVVNATEEGGLLISSDRPYWDVISNIVWHLTGEQWDPRIWDIKDAW